MQNYIKEQSKFIQDDVANVCQTYLHSEIIHDAKYKANDYLIDRLAHPDSESEFGKKTKYSKFLFRIPILNQIIMDGATSILNSQGYDALLLEYSNKIIGHTAYQIHKDNSLHVFSVEVNPIYRGRGLARLMQEHILDVARSKSIDRVRLGGGNKEVMISIRNNFSKRSKELDIILEDNYFVKILHNNPGKFYIDK